MASFGQVLKIFIGVGFPSMGFRGYIECLYVVACDNFYFSLILLFNYARFNLTPDNDASLLSLQETPLGCSSRIPGNLNVFNGFSKCIKSCDLKDLTHSKNA